MVLDTLLEDEMRIWLASRPQRAVRSFVLVNDGPKLPEGVNVFVLCRVSAILTIVWPITLHVVVGSSRRGELAPLRSLPIAAIIKDAAHFRTFDGLSSPKER